MRLRMKSTRRVPEKTLPGMSRTMPRRFRGASSSPSSTEENAIAEINQNIPERFNIFGLRHGDQRGQHVEVPQQDPIPEAQPEEDVVFTVTCGLGKDITLMQEVRLYVT